MQRESHASTSRTPRDDFDDLDTVQDTDLHHGSYPERNNAGLAASSYVNRHAARHHDKTGKGKERAWPASESGKLKRGGLASSDKNAQDGDEASSSIQRLPIEALGQVFARLPPAALFACSLVCHDWYDIIHQDSTWRAAFLYHFSLNEALVKVPGNRLSAESWQSEFVARHALAQKWTKSKVSTITHDPRVGIVSLIHADIALERHATTRSASWKPKSSKENNTHGNAPSMISISVPRGVASRSDPFSGKVAKGGFIEGAPNPIFIAGLGGNLDTVTTAAISKDGNTIAWGMANGSIHLSRTGLVGRYIHGQGQRATPPTPVGIPLDYHFGIVTSVCFVDSSEIMASAGLDGIIKLWDPTNGVLWVSPDITQLSGGRTDDIELLSARFAKLANNLVLLAAGTQAGYVFIWTIDLKTRTTLDHRKVDPLHASQETRPVETIRVDPAKSAVLIQYQLDPCFYRVGWQSEGDLQVTKFGHKEGFVSSLTAIHSVFIEEQRKLNTSAAITSINGQDTPATPASESSETQIPLRKTFGGMSYTIAGDDQGRTFMWDWDAEGSSGEATYPFRQLQGFETKVTCIEVTDLLVLIGTADGMVRAYDILSGRLVRIFNERSAPRQALRHILTGQADADEEAKWSVSQIVASREGFVASIGARILAWRAGDDHKARKKTPRSGGRLSSRAERFRTEMEMQQDIRESTAVLDHEHQDRMSRLSEYRDTQSFAGIPKSFGDMTDEEAFALAMMMSREEEEQRQQALALDMSTEDFLEDDLEHLQLEEDGEQEEAGNDNISDVISRASSYGLGSSRACTSNNNGWQPKSYEHTNSLPASPYMRPTLSPPTSAARSYSKIQLSPSLNPHLFGSPRSVSPAPDLNEVSEWPLPSPVGSAPSPIALGTSRNSDSPKVQSQSPVGRPANTWSAIASAGTNGISRTPARPTTSTSPSLLTSHLRNERHQGPVSQAAVASTQAPVEEEMDEELRFVLELSRVEEESRQAALNSASVSK